MLDRLDDALGRNATDDIGLLGARLLLITGCVCFGLLTTVFSSHALGQEVQVVRPSTDGPADGVNQTKKPLVPRTDGQTDATVAVPKELIGEPVLSLEGQTLGDVTQVQVNENGLLVSLDAELGGFFGIGSKSVRFPAENFAVNSHGIVLDMTSDDVEALMDQ
ncbi:PRC-barrel domain-containing protein [Roseibium limicola]|uniref:PRC-barrel domain-containing protein n=1 Tax=Roseibium limicola TaxID=2816037 RepID=A0A939J4U2_9HYPH|nr:PRC-barrel domain-containing protein [Roseibium limicola]MBO0345110.1 PRC-barrel domain-containing protein [Roseibium limicola]